MGRESRVEEALANGRERSKKHKKEKHRSRTKDRDRDVSTELDRRHDRVRQCSRRLYGTEARNCHDLCKTSWQLNCKDQDSNDSLGYLPL